MQRLDPQTTLYETTLEDAELEAALEEREQRKAAVGQARAGYKEADTRAKGLVEGLDLGDDAPVRVGRFVITRRRVAGRSVAFDTEPTTRLNIRPIEVQS